MYFSDLFLLCLSATVSLAENPKEENPNKGGFAFPPPNSFYLFTSGIFVFEDKMKEVACSAKLDGVGTIEGVNAHLSDDDCSKPKSLWGALYIISNEDKEKVETYAYEERLIIADVRITKKEGSETVDCVTVDVGILPHAFPLAMYTDFPSDVCVKDYLHRLKKIGVPDDYVSWLETLKANNKDDTPPSYVASVFYAPPIQDCPPPFNNGIGPEITGFEIPKDKVCVFAAGELIFEKAMKKIAPSANVVGAAMLSNEYVGVGCPTQPDKFVKYKGLDNIWGVAYTIDKKDLDAYTKDGEQYVFMSDVQARIDLTEANCKTFDVGILPSGFPFRVFKETKLEIDSYTKRLEEVGAPKGYVEALIQLDLKLDTYRECAKNPPATIGLPVIGLMDNNNVKP